MEATSFSEQATAAAARLFAGSNSGVVGQDVRDVGDAVEKFTGDPPGAEGNLPQRSVIVGLGWRCGALVDRSTSREAVVRIHSTLDHAEPVQIRAIYIGELGGLFRPQEIGIATRESEGLE